MSFKRQLIEAYKRGLKEGLQAVLDTLPQDERDFIGTLDPEKETIEFGNKDTCAAILTKGMMTRDGKQAYWLTIATHPDFRGKGLASKVLKAEVLPYVRKHDGVLFSKIKPSNKPSQRWHEKHGASKVTTNAEGWEVWKF